MASELNNFYLRGIVQTATSETSTNGKAFARVVVITDGYEDREFGGFEQIHVALEVFGRGVEAAAGAQPGQAVEAAGFLTSREKDGRWYTGFRIAAFRVVPGQAAAAPPVQAAPPIAAPVAAPVAATYPAATTADDIPF